MSESIGRLLVVDDEEMNRDMLSRRLEIEGYSVVTVESGADALRLIAEQTFDAILLDAMMPIQSGYEVLTEIRKVQSMLELPVLMVTARDGSEDIVSAFEIGANDYITKPINFPIALARISSHVSSKKLSTQLQKSEERYSLSAQGANDGLWDWDLLKNCIHFSDRWKSMLGFAPNEIGDSPNEWFDRVHPEDLPHLQRELEAHSSGRTSKFECEHRMLHQDNSYRWFLTRGMAVCDSAGRQTRMAGSQTDITRGKAADPLTGLPNRLMFMDHLTSTVNQAKTHGGDYYAVLFLDLDRFKVINDSLGHHAGDELLSEVARRLESCMRRSDLVSRLHDRCTISRFGGDEFAILLKGISEPNNAELVADRILASLSESVSLQGHEVAISTSIGIAIGSHGTDSADDLLRDADIAMYQAKTDGKSRWCVFDQVLRTKAVERLTLEQDLRKAIERDELKLHYQPIVDLRSGKIKGCEALLRWQHTTRGLVPPTEFIPIAEEIGFIVEMGTWVLEQACRQVRQWQLNYSAYSSLYVSVNVSSKQFVDLELPNHVRECLQRTGLDGRCLKLEITEGAIMLNPQIAANQLEQIRKLGVQISLDDFGTGYSSLSYLQSFKIDTLKIDRSFVSRLGGDSESDEIIRTIVNLAHNLGMEVTAEGIEEQHQHTQLNSIACETGQGYLYSKPVTVRDFDGLLQTADRDVMTSPAISFDSSADFLPYSSGSTELVQQLS